MREWASTLAAAMAVLSIDSYGQAPRPVPCSAPEAHQFDFWIGDWDVFEPDGKLSGTNRIERLYGCALHESWKSKELQGQSFNVFDARRGLWHQTWVDSNSSLLVLEGGMRGGSLTMSDATLPGRKDAARVNEITWTPNADGSVRQHWRVTKDGGKTWETAFDGKYVRSKRQQPPK
ncbi:MAG TPA: hypothetical protein VLT89_02525 [Usitatibacter sp.]|nr:hypothetical protein [Usitatibacter sp.]